MRDDVAHGAHAGQCSAGATCACAHAQGHDKLLRWFAPTFAGCLANLNNLHLHLSVGMPAFITPDFRTEKVAGAWGTGPACPLSARGTQPAHHNCSASHPQVSSTSLELHYRSLRPGLGSLVEGFVAGLAADYFNNLPVTMQLLRGRANSTCDHEVRPRVVVCTWPRGGARMQHCSGRWCSGAAVPCCRRAHCPNCWPPPPPPPPPKVWKVSYPEDRAFADAHAKQKRAEASSVLCLDAPTFMRLNPFHFVIDKDCRIAQVGTPCQPLCPAARPQPLRVQGAVLCVVAARTPRTPRTNAAPMPPRALPPAGRLCALTHRAQHGSGRECARPLPRAHAALVRRQGLELCRRGKLPGRVLCAEVPEQCAGAKGAVCARQVRGAQGGRGVRAHRGRPHVYVRAPRHLLALARCRL